MSRSSAQAASDGSEMVSPQGNLGPIYAVASDGPNIAYSTPDSGLGRIRIHDVPSSANMKPNDTLASANPSLPRTTRSASTVKTVAWVLPAADGKLLFFASLTNGTCPQNVPDQVLFNGAGLNVVALIDESRTLVVDSYGSGAGTLIIVGRSGRVTGPVTVTLGGLHDPSAIVGGQHYAAIVADAKPAVIRF